MPHPLPNQMGLPQRHMGPPGDRMMPQGPPPVRPHGHMGPPHHPGQAPNYMGPPRNQGPPIMGPRHGFMPGHPSNVPYHMPPPSGRPPHSRFDGRPPDFMPRPPSGQVMPPGPGHMSFPGHTREPSHPGPPMRMGGPVTQHGQFIPSSMRPRGYPAPVPPQLPPPPDGFTVAESRDTSAELITSSGVLGVDDEMDLEVPEEAAQQSEESVVSVRSPTEEVHTSGLQSEDISTPVEDVDTPSADKTVPQDSDKAVDVGGHFHQDQSGVEDDNMSVDGDQPSSLTLPEKDVEGTMHKSDSIMLDTSLNSGW